MSLKGTGSMTHEKFMSHNQAACILVPLTLNIFNGGINFQEVHCVNKVQNVCVT